MKALLIRLRCDSQSAHTEEARFFQSEAANRAQPDKGYGLTLALTGSSHGENRA
ncbi:MAG: hypothetical protein F6K58_29180 [Symploca sp. SIO2E9]|nr:hypothetical protein [Symploca sp. SIO2E9]